jgi:hypothetical protein
MKNDLAGSPAYMREKIDKNHTGLTIPLHGFYPAL